MGASYAVFAKALGVRTRFRVAFERNYAGHHDYPAHKAMRRRIALPGHFVRNHGNQGE
jgi:hypothetical protein